MTTLTKDEVQKISRILWKEKRCIGCNSTTNVSMVPDEDYGDQGIMVPLCPKCQMTAGDE